MESQKGNGNWAYIGYYQDCVDPCSYSLELLDPYMVLCNRSTEGSGAVSACQSR